MKIFFSLYGKELKGMRTVFLLVVIAIICIDGFMISKTKAWGYENVFILTIVSSLFIFLWSCLRTFLLIRSEWKEQTMTFLKSLPVTGWHIIGTKMLAALTEWAFLTTIALAITGLYYASAPLLGEEYLEIGNLLTILPLPNLLVLIICTVICISFVLSIFGMTVQLGYLLGEAVQRFKGLIQTVAPVLLVYFLIRVSEILGSLLSFMPYLSIDPLSFIGASNLLEGCIYVPLSLFLILIVLFAPMLYLTGWVLEKKAEA